VRDKDKMATFSGDVHLVQGDTEHGSKTLVVFYEDECPREAGDAVRPAQPRPDLPRTSRSSGSEAKAM